MASVKVAVRVRPFNQREIEMGAELIIQMKNKTTGIINNKANARDEHIRYKEFTFDHSYWSHDKGSEDFASQEDVYNDLGTEVVDCAFQGYNACVFAYGQTGSGKTFTMMGSPENQGLIPRICKALFDKMAENSLKGTTHRVQVSYLEIYQEKVADLLRARDSTSLKVREHPKKGPYVEGLTSCLVTNYEHIQGCMDRGNSHRTTASTNMNDVSSRSHAIFTITFVQAGYCDGVPSETVSKIHLVDLAGSERADATGATGQRLKEGAHINKSLVTLGSVISALAELSSVNPEHSNHGRKSFFIPYRDSVLTWLLKDSLGGNSKTIMIAAISPADCNYGETLSTLRYANRAKNIINKPTVNEDPNVKLIRELRDEIAKLKALMFSEHRSDMLAQLHEKEAREKELTEEWAGKWREAQAILREQRALGLRKSGPGVVLDSDRPHLVAIDDDPLSTGVTLYHLKEGETRIGTEDSEVPQDIELRGAGMEPQHCVITFKDGVATLHPQPGAHVMLNNNLIDTSSKLSQGCIIFLGKAHVFRFNDPAEAAELRKGEKTYNLSRLSLLSWSTPDLAISTENLQISERSSREENVELEKQAKSETENKFKEESIMNQREKLEGERGKLMTQIYSDLDCLEQTKFDFKENLHDFFKLSNAKLQGNLDETRNLTLEELVTKHRVELAELQAELEKRVETLAEHRKTVENIDGKLLELIQEQSKFTNDNNKLDELRQALASRTTEEMAKIELRKQSLTLNLQNLNSVGQSGSKTPSSSETYHTAASDTPSTPFSGESCNKICGNFKNLMCDSGVEMRSKNQDESDLSSTELDYKINTCDTRSTSSTENQMQRPVLRKKRVETLRKLAHRISLQKQLIIKTLDSGNCGKLQLDSQISVLQELQRQYVAVKSRSNGTTYFNLIPAEEHPLQSDSESPSPLKPVYTGSTSTLYSNVQLSENHGISQSFYRSMPSVTEPNEEDFSIVSISSFCLRGAGAKTHYEYEVRISTIDDRWSILRRYSRFRDLHIAMKARYGKLVSKIPFPSKHLFANSNESVARSRKRQLEDYLQKLIERTAKDGSRNQIQQNASGTRRFLVSQAEFQLKFHFRRIIFSDNVKDNSRKLAKQYKFFVENERDRVKRNEDILHSLARIQDKIENLSDKTERMKRFRREYHQSLYGFCKKPVENNTPRSANLFTFQHERLKVHENPAEYKGYQDDLKRIKNSRNYKKVFKQNELSDESEDGAGAEALTRNREEKYAETRLEDEDETAASPGNYEENPREMLVENRQDITEKLDEKPEQFLVDDSREIVPDFTKLHMASSLSLVHVEKLQELPEIEPEPPKIISEETQKPETTENELQISPPNSTVAEEFQISPTDLKQVLVETTLIIPEKLSDSTKLQSENIIEEILTETTRVVPKDLQHENIVEETSPNSQEEVEAVESQENLEIRQAEPAEVSCEIDANQSKSSVETNQNLQYANNENMSHYQREEQSQNYYDYNHHQQQQLQENDAEFDRNGGGFITKDQPYEPQYDENGQRMPVEYDNQPLNDGGEYQYPQQYDEKSNFIYKNQDEYYDQNAYGTYENYSIPVQDVVESDQNVHYNEQQQFDNIHRNFNSYSNEEMTPYNTNDYQESNVMEENASNYYDDTQQQLMVNEENDSGNCGENFNSNFVNKMLSDDNTPSEISCAKYDESTSDFDFSIQNN